MTYLELLAGTPSRNTAHHVIIHGTKRLVELVRDGLSFERFIG